MGVLYDIIQGLKALDKISLKSLAEAVDAQPQRMYSISKQPVPGQPYDPKAINWDAIERFLNRRIEAIGDKLEGIHDLESAVKRAIELEDASKETKGTRSTASTVSQKPRKFSNFEQNANKFICLKKDADIYAIVMQTETHTVVRPVNPKNTDEFLNGTLKVLSNNTLNQQGIGPSMIDKAIQDRIDGLFKAPVTEAEPVKEAG